jgi:8-hydroxy-5-deazaflavin:NADPH oxidoreductase
MRIGIIGTGNMGKALGVQWAQGGHQVLFGSRDRRKAGSVAASCSAQAGDFDDAAAFGEAVLYTVREALPSSLLRSPRSLAGKIVIDCNNSGVLGLDLPDPDRRPGFHFATPSPSLAERLAADVRLARVVKAFNTMPARVIELGREILARHRISAFLCSDHADAKAVVEQLAGELGLVPVDAGELEHARLVEAVADLVRLQILARGTGPGTTISLHRLEELRP